MDGIEPSGPPRVDKRTPYQRMKQKHDDLLNELYHLKAEIEYGRKETKKLEKQRDQLFKKERRLANALKELEKKQS